MKKKVINSLLFGGLGVLAIGSVSTVVLTSCSDNTPRVKKLYNDYNKEVTDAIGNGTYFVDSSRRDAVLEVMYSNIAKAKDLQKTIYKDYDSKKNKNDVDEKIWIDTVLFQMEVEKASVETEAYLLGAPVGGNICSQYNNTFIDYADHLWKFSNDDDWKNRFELFQKIVKILKNNFQDGINEGVTISGIMLKLFVNDILKICYEPNLNNWLEKNPSGKEINSTNWLSALKLNSSDNNKPTCTYIQDNVKERFSDPEFKIKDKKKIETDAIAADKIIDEFTNFIIKDYWAGVKYGWNNTKTSGGTATRETNDGFENGKKPDVFKLTIKPVSDTGEVTNTFPVEAGKTNTIAGLGLTKADLETKDIGIGFSGFKGLKIYQDYLLYKNTTLYKDASKVNQLGIDNVSLIKENMKEAAANVAKLVANGETTWKPMGYTYDNDIFDQELSKPFNEVEGFSTTGLATKEGDKYTVSDDQLKLFFKWVNSDQWFFGRDILDKQVINLDQKITGENKDYNIAQGYGTKDDKKVYQTGTVDDSVASYKALDGYVEKLGSGTITQSNEFGDARDLYKKYVVDKKGIAPGATNVNGVQAYAGATFSMDSYQRWQDAVKSKIADIFVKSEDKKDLNAPTELKLNVNVVTGTGGAAYANGGTFYLDVNPYFGLQKWSMTTLSSHESLPGHNLQMIYASDNPASSDAPAEFNYTSYAEGWGLFSEWLAVQYGAYGKPTELTSATDWLDSKKRMQLPNFEILDFDGKDSKFDVININIDEANKDLGKSGNEFMNGIFETNFNGTSTKDSKTLKQAYYNTMEYFGFLNERQLRAMRMTLDTSVHAGGPISNKGEIESNFYPGFVGKAIPGTGWSLQDEIDYMQANSGLGQGDVTREAQRYLNYVAQATSYLTGEIVIEDLFGKASAAYSNKNSNKLFMDFKNLKGSQNNTAPFFNLILRNGDIPLAVLQKYGEEYITNNIGAIPTAPKNNQ